MQLALSHRGPDGFGTYHDESVALGHCRLSILDLAHGGQPMANREGTLHVVFNGEIYNHPDLRRQLESRGARYDTRSDTETILHAYNEWGTATAEHLDGMFAFVIYDSRRKLLYGARDRFGKKPLFYTNKPFGNVAFAFASELKALKAHPDIGPQLQISADGLFSYFLNDYIRGETTIFEALSSLQAGSAFRWGLPGSGCEGFNQWRYWSVSFERPVLEAEPSLREAGEQTLELLSQSVEKRLQSDVPVGVLLSGGLDSSTVLALLRKHGQAPLKTFSIGFQESSFDESGYAEQIAEFFHTTHIQRTFTTTDLVERVPQVVRALDEPFADPSVFPTSFLSELASEHVKVVMGGDGADELFAGYDPFKALSPARCYRRMVRPSVHNLIVACSSMMRDSGRNMPLAFRISRFLRGACADATTQVPIWMGPFSLVGVQKLLPDLASAFEPGQLLERHVAIPDCSDTKCAVQAALEFYQKCYLTDNILVKLDRAGMLHALEIRSPFLDTALAEYVNRLPSWMKYRRGRTKFLLKQAVLRSGLLPKSIVKRRKKGFGIPVARWIRVELHDFFREILLGDWPSILDVVDRGEVKRLWDQHNARRANHYKELWAIFMLVQWARHAFDDSRSSADIQSSARSLQLKPYSRAS